MKRFFAFGALGTMPFWSQWLIAIVNGEAEVSCRPSTGAWILYFAFMTCVPFAINGCYALEQKERLDKSGWRINLTAAIIATIVVFLIDQAFRFSPDGWEDLFIAAYALTAIFGTFLAHVGIYRFQK